MGIDFRDLSPKAQAQVLEKLAQDSPKNRSIIRNITGKDYGPAPRPQGPAAVPPAAGEVLFCATVLGKPITKKNHMEIRKRADGKRFIGQSNKFEAYAEVFKSQIFYTGPPIECIVNVQEVYYMPTRQLVDKLNLQAATDDLLVECGVLKDDNSRIVGGHDGSRVRLDRDNPRVEITITRLEETEVED